MDAGLFDETELRRRYSGKSKAIAMALAASLLGAWFWGEAKEEFQIQRRRFIQRLISEELKSVPDDAGLNEKQLRMRLTQEHAKVDELTERIVAIAQAVDLD